MQYPAGSGPRRAGSRRQHLQRANGESATLGRLLERGGQGAAERVAAPEPAGRADRRRERLVCPEHLTARANDKGHGETPFWKSARTPRPGGTSRAGGWEPARATPSCKRVHLGLRRQAQGCRQAAGAPAGGTFKARRWARLSARTSAPRATWRMRRAVGVGVVGVVERGTNASYPRWFVSTVARRKRERRRAGARARSGAMVSLMDARRRRTTECWATWRGCCL